MLTTKTYIYTKDSELIELTEEIFEWIKSHKPPIAASNVNLVGRRFTELSYNVETTSEFQYTEAINTSQQSLVTFFVTNTGAGDAVVKLQISPNNLVYVDDGIEIVVQPGELKALVPMIFAKYTHLGYKSASAGNGTLEITVQASI